MRRRKRQRPACETSASCSRRPWRRTGGQPRGAMEPRRKRRGGGLTPASSSRRRSRLSPRGRKGPRRSRRRWLLRGDRTRGEVCRRRRHRRRAAGSWSPVGGVPRGKEWRTACGSGGSGARWRPVSRVRRGWRTAWTSMRAQARPGCPTTCGHGWTRRRRQGAEALTSGLWRPSHRGRTRRRQWLRLGKGRRKSRRRRKWRTKRRTPR